LDFDLINFAGVLSDDSELSINLFSAICLDAPLTIKAIFLEADKTFGVKDIRFIPLPKLVITNSSVLLFL